MSSSYHTLHNTSHSTHSRYHPLTTYFFATIQCILLCFKSIALNSCPFAVFDGVCLGDIIIIIGSLHCQIGSVLLMILGPTSLTGVQNTLSLYSTS